ERQQLLNCRDHRRVFIPNIDMGARARGAVTRKIEFDLWDEPIPSHPIFRNKVEDKANQFHWVANLIEKGRTQWDISKGLIH
ncbi:hypothetical protein HAX54_028845, partial [Datura stramonium]|nr:hypothetical protein [Datura stramonium]